MELQPGLGVSLPRRPGPEVEDRCPSRPGDPERPRSLPAAAELSGKGRATGEAEARFREPEPPLLLAQTPPRPLSVHSRAQLTSLRLSGPNSAPHSVRETRH